LKKFLIPPISPIILLVLALLMPIIFLMFAESVRIAFLKLGIPASVAYLLFISSLFGSFINIPIAEIKSYVPTIKVSEVTFFGIRYVVPYLDISEDITVVAVNLGGCLIPLSVSLYILLTIMKTVGIQGVLRAIIAVVVASLVINSVSRPVKGLGIAVPTFVPPLVAILLALILDTNKPAIAYISGTLGTLIGADLMNWRKLKNIGAQMVSIGGAGTFDGIYLSGLFAVLLV